MQFYKPLVSQVAVWVFQMLEKETRRWINSIQELAVVVGDYCEKGDGQLVVSIPLYLELSPSWHDVKFNSLDYVSSYA